MSLAPIDWISSTLRIVEAADLELDAVVSFRRSLMRKSFTSNFLYSKSGSQSSPGKRKTNFDISQCQCEEKGSLKNNDTKMM